MPRPTLRSPELAAFLVVALITLSAVPTADASARGFEDTRGCEQMGHSMPSERAGGDTPCEAPADSMACCMSAPGASRDAVAPLPSPVPAPVEVALPVVAVPPSAPVPHAPLNAKRPLPGLRLHLALSVFLV